MSPTRPFSSTDGLELPASGPSGPAALGQLSFLSKQPPTGRGWLASSSFLFLTFSEPRPSCLFSVSHHHPFSFFSELGRSVQPVEAAALVDLQLQAHAGARKTGQHDSVIGLQR